MNKQFLEELTRLADDLADMVEFSRAQSKECLEAGRKRMAAVWEGQCRAHRMDLERLQGIIKEMEEQKCEAKLNVDLWE